MHGLIFKTSIWLLAGSTRLLLRSSWTLKLFKYHSKLYSFCRFAFFFKVSIKNTIIMKWFKSKSNQWRLSFFNWRIPIIFFFIIFYCQLTQIISNYYWGNLKINFPLLYCFTGCPYTCFTTSYVQYLFLLLYFRQYQKMILIQ